MQRRRSQSRRRRAEAALIKVVDRIHIQPIQKRTGAAAAAAAGARELMWLIEIASEACPRQSHHAM